MITEPGRERYIFFPNKEEFLLEDAEVPQGHPEKNEDKDRAPTATPDLLGSPAGYGCPQ